MFKVGGRLIYLAAFVLLASCVAADDPSTNALHGALISGSISEVTDLLDAGVSLTIRDNLGYTPLHRACDDGSDASPEIVELLLARGAGKGEATSSEGVVLAKGKAIDSRDNNMATALMLAAGGGQAKIIELLVAAGADLGSQDEFGMRPLHYAAESGHADAVETLLRLGADPDVEDEVGKTPADVARAWGFPDVAKVFGPVATITDAKSTTPELPEGAVPLFKQGEGTGDRQAKQQMPDNLKPEKLEL